MQSRLYLLLSIRRIGLFANQDDINNDPVEEKGGGSRRRRRSRGRERKRDREGEIEREREREKRKREGEREREKEREREGVGGSVIAERYIKHKTRKRDCDG